MKFFTAMKKIVDSIYKKSSKLEDENEELKGKLALTYAEKEDYVLKYNIEHEKYQKLQIDFDTLEKDVEDLFKIERKFNEMKLKQLELITNLDKKEAKIAQMKPKLYELE